VVVASRAVAAGHRVAMVYREPYGSTCVNVGCVPSKFLIHRANVAHTVRTAPTLLGFDPFIDLVDLIVQRAEGTGSGDPEPVEPTATPR